METLRLLPFDDTVLDDAAILLAARQRRDRQHEPALPERFVEPGAARAALLAAWHEADASGVVALRDGRVAGFLIGAPEVAEIWGRSVWVRFGGHALAAKEDADLYRDLYAAAAPRWLARGCFAHYVEIGADDRAGLDAWFRLSFGLQQAYGIRPLPATDLPQRPRPPQDPALTIRRAGPDDRDTLAEMQGMLWAHLGRSPIYSVRLPEDTQRWQVAAAEALADPQVAVWLAEQDGVALGAVEISPLTSGDAQLDIPEGCCYFAFAATREEARGRGISTTLTTHALHEAHAAGYLTSLTDWRVTNVQASRLWPQLGFRPFQYRLHRLLDDRIAWAPSFPE
jgi:ribosomal protein S18 acetylase RimI-like enzyme